MGNLAGILILVGDGTLSAPPAMMDFLRASVPLSGSANRVDFGFGFFGVFHWGSILQSGSYPSTLARALVMRRGGDVMLCFELRTPRQRGEMELLLFSGLDVRG